MSMISSRSTTDKRSRRQTPPATDRPEIESKLVRVAWLLNYLGYPEPAVATTLDHLRKNGTAQGCTSIGDRDRRPIDDLLA